MAIKVIVAGNSLFAHMAVGAVLSRHSQAHTQQKAAEFAAKWQQHLLKWVAAAITAQTLIYGVLVSTWLLDTDERLGIGITTVDHYLERMIGWGQGDDRWGGLPEVVVLSHMWQVRRVLWQESTNSKSCTLHSCMHTTSTWDTPICIWRQTQRMIPCQS